MRVADEDKVFSAIKQSLRRELRHKVKEFSSSTSHETCWRKPLKTRLQATVHPKYCDPSNLAVFPISTTRAKHRSIFGYLWPSVHAIYQRRSDLLCAISQKKQSCCAKQPLRKWRSASSSSSWSQRNADYGTLEAEAKQPSEAFKGPRFTAWLTPVSSLCLNSESIEGKGQMHQSSKCCEGDSGMKSLQLDLNIAFSSADKHHVQ